MNNESRWNTYLTALNQYVQEHGNARVPISYKATTPEGGTINLGIWVGYIRQRRRQNKLAQNRVDILSGLPGWEWGPLRPGPQTDNARNAEIQDLRASGWTLQAIAYKYGLSRQRVHQIVGGTAGETE